MDSSRLVLEAGTFHRVPYASLNPETSQVVHATYLLASWSPETDHFRSGGTIHKSLAGVFEADRFLPGALFRVPSKH